MTPIKHHNTALDRGFQGESVCGGRIMVFGNAKTAIVGDSISRLHNLLGQMYRKWFGYEGRDSLVYDIWK